MLTKILRSSLIDFRFVTSEKRLGGVDPSIVTTCKLLGSMYAKAKLMLMIISISVGIVLSMVSTYCVSASKGRSVGAILWQFDRALHDS